jgi:predicted transcriptional regulator
MWEDRCQIYALSKRGASQESIAEVLGVSQSAVSREMYRNQGQRGYRFKQAEAKAQASQAIRSKPRKLTAPVRRRIEAKLRQMRWSPEQISGWLCEQGIKLSHECIYQTPCRSAWYSAAAARPWAVRSRLYLFSAYLFSALFDRLLSVGAEIAGADRRTAYPDVDARAILRGSVRRDQGRE